EEAENAAEDDGLGRRDEGPGWPEVERRVSQLQTQQRVASPEAVTDTPTAQSPSRPKTSAAKAGRTSVPSKKKVQKKAAKKVSKKVSKKTSKTSKKAGT